MEERQPIYTSRHLAARLDAIKKDFFLDDEFPLSDRDGEPRAELIKAAAADPGALERYASKLSGRELENLLLALAQPVSEAEAARADAILRLRMGKRMAALVWSLFQLHHRNRKISGLMAFAAGYLPSADGFITRIARSDDPSDELSSAMLAFPGRFDEFFEKYGISSGGALSEEAQKRCFKVCGAEVFLKNSAFAAHRLRDTGDPAWPEMFSNYLKRLSREEYISAVNEQVISSLGLPGEGPVWERIDRRLAEEFTLWHRLYLIRRHTAGNPYKTAVLAGYPDRIISVEVDAGLGLAVVGFKNFFIADWAAQRDVSYFIGAGKYASLGEGPERFLNLGRLMTSGAPTARQYIFGAADDEIILLGYGGVDKLYTREVIEITLGIIPDTRRKNHKNR